MLINDAAADGAGDAFELFQRDLRVAVRHVHHQIADFAFGNQRLCSDVDAVFGEKVVDRREHAGLVTVDVQQAVRVFAQRQRYFGEV